MTLKTVSLINTLLLEFFNDDEDKVILWLNTKNPLLGGLAPIEMVLQGREQKLLRFIQDSLEENNS